MSFHTAIGGGAPTVYFVPQNSLQVHGPVVS
eukprot:CAMPEP_0174291104 /NCGR_PEP_ID=MMETSP0809-20121228/31051_1 /TAXON_ID=73025 ORGANISM="Eutreptiella gymnastica-like, Strain CCMP1594" /NCGR_SAMPLE_ID=MMETSP0809 /ASSEMBLY_ACC=CAM_ASM_000658 /LENGTH=30 /DNA_ID= /DNA_START= /DNA_END= /DNA_ORIENTATION=